MAVSRCKLGKLPGIAGLGGFWIDDEERGVSRLGTWQELGS